MILNSALQTWELSDIAAGTVVIGFVGASVYAVLAARLGGRFVALHDHFELKRQAAELQVRVAALEVGIAQLPTRTHLNEVSHRVERLAESVATTNGQLEAVREGIGSIDRTVNLMLTSQLEREKR